MTTFAGTPDSSAYADGIGTAAQFDTPLGIAIVGSGAYAVVVRRALWWVHDLRVTRLHPCVLWQADGFNACLRRIDLATAAVTTIAGNPRTEGLADGTGSNALFSIPWGVAVDAAGTFVLVVRIDAAGSRGLVRSWCGQMLRAGGVARMPLCNVSALLYNHCLRFPRAV